MRSPKPSKHEEDIKQQPNMDSQCLMVAMRTPGLLRVWVYVVNRWLGVRSSELRKGSDEGCGIRNQVASSPT